MMNIKNIAGIAAVLAAAMLFLNACGIYGKYQSNVPEDLQNVVIPTYSEVFNDPNLTALIDTALARNLDLKIAHERVMQAHFRLTAAKLAYLPRISAGGAPAVTLNSTKGISAWSYTMGTASWEIDIFGRVTNRKRIASSAKEEALAFEQAARTELIAAVATLYYNLQMINAQILATDIASSNWEKSVSAIRDMKEAGLADQAGVSQFEGSYYATLASSKSLGLLKYTVENELRYLLSSDSYDIVLSPISTESALKMDCQKLENVNLQIVRTRPDVRAAEMRLAQSFYNVNLARANMCPSITLGGTLNWADGGMLYQAIGGLLQPIFNAGDNISQLKVSKSQYEVAKMEYANVLLAAGNEVNNSIAEIKAYKSRVDDCRNRVNAMAIALEATQLKMKYGRGTYLEVLTAQNDLLNAQIAEIQNTADIMTSVVDLFQAIGGGKQ